jgi:glyoxylase-like metal-dependent hydrolase (beta-lactamase superfamily II)
VRHACRDVHIGGIVSNRTWVAGAIRILIFKSVLWLAGVRDAFSHTPSAEAAAPDHSAHCTTGSSRRLLGLVPMPTLTNMAPQLVQITETVHLVQTKAVNWLAVTDDSGAMLIDAGYPGDRDDVLTSLRQLGYQAGDVRAILLTHAHVDHMGSAIWFAKTHGTPVYCHANEIGHAKREFLEQVSISDIAARLWRPTWATWTIHVLRSGGLTREGIPTVQPLTAEAAGQLPGHPIAIPTPGHTGGHCSYLVDGVLASGDALVTGHPLLRRNGPQLLPAIFSHNQDDSIRSLAALALLETEMLAPGHGDLWRGPIREATDQATARARR